jgi:hypothetical protein
MDLIMAMSSCQGRSSQPNSKGITIEIQ